MTSGQNKIAKKNKPRVQLEIDVETNGSTVKKTIPMVIGAMGHYSGNNPGVAVKALKDRKFVQIDGENFDDFMGKMQPGLKFKVDNVLGSDENSELGIELVFRSMDDFSPEAVVQQVKPLRELLEVRNRLRDLLTKSDRSDDLERLLETLLKDENGHEQLATFLNSGAK